MKAAIITSGGDSPGMNPLIRYLTRALIENGHEVIGYKNGYRGIVNNEKYTLTYDNVAGLLKIGGTILGTSRFPEFKDNPATREKAKEVLKKENIDVLIVVGGDGSLRGAHALSLIGVKCIVLPASIDNDMYGTDETLGMHTALTTIQDAVDKIKDTASSHDRTFIIEVMGHRSGFLAVNAAIVTGAEGVFIPEVDTDVDELAIRLRKRYEEGRRNSIIIVAEGKASASEIAELLKEKNIGYDIRISVLGHIQRGGIPVFHDRLLAFTLAMGTLKAINQNRLNVFVGVKGGETTFTPLEDAVKNRKTLSPFLINSVYTFKWED